MSRLYIYLFILLLGACTGSKHTDSVPASPYTVAQVLEHFHAPPSRYAPMPLFVWNGKVTKEELETQLADLKSKGFGGVFVHPRPGLITEYLSDEWFDLFGYTLEQCKKLDMEVWIYDENSYPSGFAGGHVPDRMPSSYNEGVGLKGILTDQLPADLSACEVVLKKTGSQWEDITAHTGDSLIRQGTFYLFEKTYYDKTPWNAGFSYVDLLKPGVTHAFLDITMTQGYERHFAESFGSGIQGMFSDEPAIYAPDWHSIRWTPGLFDAFRHKWGYDLRPHLPSLIEETGNWKEVRHNYYSILLQLFVDNWARPMSDYCEKNKLKWTGHYWEHEWPDPDNCPDNMAMYAYFQQPGIDLLFNNFDEEKYFPATPNNWPQPQFGCARNIRELNSVANQLGKERSLCEMYGAGGWEFNFRDLKRLGDWSYALGVNFLCQHLSFMTIQGARKYDHPASFSYHAPWWDQYQSLNDYFRRLSFALTSGGQINKILVIEPTTTAWMYTQKGSISNRMAGIGKSFQDFLIRLEKEQIEYDLASEYMIDEYGTVADNRLQIGKRIYDRVIIPEMTENLNAATIGLLNKSKNTEILNLASIQQINGKEQMNNPYPVRDMADILPAALFTDEWQVIHHDSKQGNLFHHRRTLNDGQVLFFANADTAESVQSTFRIKGNHILTLDLHTGKCFAYPSQPDKGYVTFTVNIPPSGSLLLLASDEKAGNYPLMPGEINYQMVEASSGLQINPLEKNVLTLDFCDLILHGEKHPEIHTVKASDLVFRQYGFQGNPWNSAVQFKDRLLAHPFPKESGYQIIYRFSVRGDVDISSMKLVAENTGGIIKINNHPLQPLPGEWWLDRSFKVYPAADYIRQGINEISITISPMHMLAEIEPVYLLGDFSLESASKGWIITLSKTLQQGSWKEQGMPFYAKAVDYTKTYHIDAETSCRIRLSQWQGSVSEIRVNDQPAGLIYLPPYTLDTSDKIKPGENRITVRVYGSNKNLLGPFHGNIEEGLVGPGQWKDIENMPEGNAYQQIHYGLFADFILEKNRNL